MGSYLIDGYQSIFSYWWRSVFISGVFTGVWISISRRRWVGVWIGLELNLLCFIPVMLGHRRVVKESRIVYFLAQACGSLVLLITGLNLISYEFIFDIFIGVALLLKIGAAPFHFWYVEVANSLKWIQFIILRTIQKIAPLVLLSLTHIRGSRRVVYTRVVMCGAVGAAGGVSSLSIRKLLIYSSISHLGWLLLPISNKNLLWVTYFIIYCLILLLVVVILIRSRVFHIGQLKGSQILWGDGVSLLIGLLSLGGLPPFLGFAAKWGVIIRCTNFVDLFCLVVLILSSVVRVYFYVRSVFVILTTGSSAKFKRAYKSRVRIHLTTISVSLIGFWLSFIIIF